MLWLRFEAARWVQIAVPAVVVAALATVIILVAARDSGVPLAGVLLIAAVAAVVGALFGVLLGERNESSAILQGLGTRQARAAAQRAVRRGPAPADPAIRRAAYELACLQLAATTRAAAQRGRIVWTVGFALFLCALAFTDHSWITRGWKLAAALLYVMPVVTYPRNLRRLRDRQALLAETPRHSDASPERQE